MTKAYNKRELEHARTKLFRRLGREIRQMREDAGRSQAAIAKAAGLSNGYVSMVEGGDVEPSIDVLMRLGDVLGAELGVRYFAGTGPRIRDRTQIVMADTVIGTLHRRWRAAPEVAVYRPVHGVIDLLLEDRTGPDTVATELQGQLRRVEQLLRWQGQKADALATQPDQQGRRVSRLLVLRNTHAMRELARGPAGATLRAAYPPRPVTQWAP